MLTLFYLAAAVAVLATLLALTRLDAVHGLLYLIVSLLAVALTFALLGAPFVAALEVIVYAGAIMVLFVFVVMLLNLGPRATAAESAWLRPHTWLGPSALGVILIAEVLVMLARAGSLGRVQAGVAPQAVALALYGPYRVGLELASFLLLAGLVGAYHLGRSGLRK